MAGAGLFSKKAPVKPHLVQTGATGGVAAEVADLRDDVKRELAPMAALSEEEFTNPPAADVDAIKTAFASAVTAQSYSGAALNGVVGGADLLYPRNITVTTGAGGTPADVPATMTVTGLDVNGDVLTETINISQTAGTAVGAKCFKRVTQLDFPVGQGTGGTMEVGFGAIIGLGKKIRVLAGAVSLLKEHAAGSVVTNGVLANPTTSPPNGSYAPNSAPDGTRDYWVLYAFDPLA